MIHDNLFQGLNLETKLVPQVAKQICKEHNQIFNLDGTQFRK